MYLVDYEVIRESIVSIVPLHIRWEETAKGERIANLLTATVDGRYGKRIGCWNHRYVTRRLSPYRLVELKSLPVPRVVSSLEIGRQLNIAISRLPFDRETDSRAWLDMPPRPEQNYEKYYELYYKEFMKSFLAN